MGRAQARFQRALTVLCQAEASVVQTEPTILWLLDHVRSSWNVTDAVHDRSVPKIGQDKGSR